MLICKNCSNQQDEGKFCGLCGGPLIDGDQTESEFTSNSTASVPQDIANDLPNKSVELVKNRSQIFGSFFQDYIRNPFFIFESLAGEFTNGLISILLNIILLSLSMTILSNNFIGNYVNFSVIGTFFNAFLILSVGLSLPIGLVFVIDKFFGSKNKLKAIIAIFGGHMLPILILSGLAFILSILKSNTFTSFLIFIIFIIMTVFLPLYLVSLLVSRRQDSIDPFYSYLIYIIVSFIGLIITTSIIVDSAIGRVLDELMYFL